MCNTKISFLVLGVDTLLVRGWRKKISLSLSISTLVLLREFEGRGHLSKIIWVLIHFSVCVERRRYLVFPTSVNKDTLSRICFVGTFVVYNIFIEPQGS